MTAYALTVAALVIADVIVVFWNFATWMGAWR